MVTSEEGSGVGRDWEFGSDMYTLYYNQQGCTADSTEDAAQCCNNPNGKSIRKRMDLCITESLCCTPETNTTFSINYTPINIFLIILKREVKMKKTEGN